MGEGKSTPGWNGSGMITLPKWLWAVMGTAILWAGYVTIRLTSLAAAMEVVAGGVQANQATIEAVRAEQISRTRSVYAVERLQEDVRKLEARVERLEGR